jgi:hypothetical protein
MLKWRFIEHTYPKCLNQSVTTHGSVWVWEPGLFDGPFIVVTLFGSALSPLNRYDEILRLSINHPNRASVVLAVKFHLHDERSAFWFCFLIVSLAATNPRLIHCYLFRLNHPHYVSYGPTLIKTNKKKMHCVAITSDQIRCMHFINPRREMIIITFPSISTTSPGLSAVESGGGCGDCPVSAAV